MLHISFKVSGNTCLLHYFGSAGVEDAAQIIKNYFGSTPETVVVKKVEPELVIFKSQLN